MEICAPFDLPFIIRICNPFRTELFLRYQSDSDWYIFIHKTEKLCNQASQAVNELWPHLLSHICIILLTGPSIHDCQTAWQHVIMPLLKNLTQRPFLIEKRGNFGLKNEKAK